MSTLSDLVRKQREKGGSITSSLSYGVKERLKEKLDPRQFLDQSGILTALFPKLKAYKAGQSKDAKNIFKKLEKVTSPEPIGDVSFRIIEKNTKISAKNTMVLPAMHRDINVMRQNIAKLVKAKGVNPTNKADMWFMNAKTMEAAYETRFNKKTPEKVEKGKEIKPEGDSGLMGLLGGLVKQIGEMINTAVSSALGAFAGMTMGGLVNTLAARLFPMVFSWASVPALGLALAAQQAGSADLNNQKQGIIEPIKRAYKAAQDGNLGEVATELGNINIFTAVGRAGLEFSNSANETLGFNDKWEKQREKNRDTSSELSPGQSAASSTKNVTIEQSIKHYENMLSNAKESDKPTIQNAINVLKEQKSKQDGKTPSKEQTPKSGVKPTPVATTPTSSAPKSSSNLVPTEATNKRTGEVVSMASEEVKTAQREVSGQPVVNVIEQKETKTLPQQGSSSDNLSLASVYDMEFLKLLGMSNT